MVVSQAMKSSNQEPWSEDELLQLQREAQKRMKIAEEAVYEEMFNGVIVDPFPYKIKTAEYHYGGPSDKYPMWAVTTHFIDGVRQRDVYLISDKYFEKYPECCDPLASGTEEIFLRRFLYPMFQKRNAVKDMELQ